MSISDGRTYPWTKTISEEYNSFIKDNSKNLIWKNEGYYEYIPDCVQPAATLIQSAWRGYKERDPFPIEHLYNPFMAMENIYKYIKPGGYVYTSVPTINIPHMTPIHYNGYNPYVLFNSRLSSLNVLSPISKFSMILKYLIRASASFIW